MFAIHFKRKRDEQRTREWEIDDETGINWLCHRPIYVLVGI